MQTRLKLPDGRTLPVDARVFKVENSREDVTKSGKIQGIRSTGTIGHSAENQIASLAQIDPVASLLTSSAGPAVLGFAEPEILYSAGTEIDIEFTRPVITAQKYEPSVPRMNLPEADSMVKIALHWTLRRRSGSALHKWDPPHFEIGIQGEYSRYVNNFLEETIVDIGPLQG